MPYSNEWMEKIGYMYSVKSYSAIQSNDNMRFEGKWVQLEDIMLSEVNQAQKVKSSYFISDVEDTSKR
jgi:hypothetical protein